MSKSGLLILSARPVITQVCLLACVTCLSARHTQILSLLYTDNILKRSTEGNMNKHLMYCFYCLMVPDSSVTENAWLIFYLNPSLGI